MPSRRRAGRGDTGRLADGDPVVGCVGGAKPPDWEVPAPAWLSPRVALGLTIIDWPGDGGA
jgi:hypothetical protein